jgi:hypothetical protein
MSKHIFSSSRKSHAKSIESCIFITLIHFNICECHLLIAVIRNDSFENFRLIFAGDSRDDGKFRSDIQSQ